MLFQPFLQLRELGRTRLSQCARGELPHPVVVDAQGFSYRPVLAYGRLNGLAGFLDPFFYAHAC